MVSQTLMTNDTEHRIETFRAKHPDWCETHLSDLDSRVVYCLPPASLRTLAFRTSVALNVGDATVTAEREFTRFCERSGGVGIDVNGVVLHQPLAGFLSSPSPDVLPSTPEFGEAIWPADWHKRLSTCVDKANVASERVLARCGMLLTTPGYHQSVRELRDRYDSLPPSQRPALPFSAIGLEHPPIFDHPDPADGVIQDGGRLTIEGLEFRQSVLLFLRRWHLAQLTSWELPLPRDLVGLAFRGDHPIADLIDPDDLDARPEFWPEPIWNELAAAFRNRSDFDAAETGMPSEGRLGQKLQTYGNLFRAAHYCRVLRSRYAGEGKRAPNGFREAERRVLADGLGLSESTVGDLLKTATQCLNGRWAESKLLRPQQTRHRRRLES